jgi:hypothetical protein
MASAMWRNRQKLAAAVGPHPHLETIVTRRYITVAETAEYLQNQRPHGAPVDCRWRADRIPDGPLTPHDPRQPQ